MASGDGKGSGLQDPAPSESEVDANTEKLTKMLTQLQATKGDKLPPQLVVALSSVVPRLKSKQGHKDYIKRETLVEFFFWMFQAITDPTIPKVPEGLVPLLGNVAMVLSPVDGKTTSTSSSSTSSSTGSSSTADNKQDFKVRVPKFTVDPQELAKVADDPAKLSEYVTRSMAEQLARTPPIVFNTGLPPKPNVGDPLDQSIAAGFFTVAGTLNDANGDPTQGQAALSMAALTKTMDEIKLSIKEGFNKHSKPPVSTSSNADEKHSRLDEKGKNEKGKQTPVFFWPFAFRIFLPYNA